MVAQKRPQGRPFKISSTSEHAAASWENPRSKRPEKKRAMKNLKSRLRMSLLEKLPTELLENIFFHCMNLDLPQASPIIGGKLSSQSVYIKSLMAAFGPTWKKWHSEIRSWDYWGTQRRSASISPGEDLVLQVRSQVTHIS